MSVRVLLGVCFFVCLVCFVLALLVCVCSYAFVYFVLLCFVIVVVL